MARVAEATRPAELRPPAIEATPLRGLFAHGGLLAALGVSLLYGVRAMAPALGPGGAIEEEARQHVFWMARFRDPGLFPNDLIADYFQAVSPPGYSALYWALSPLFDPFDVARVLPLVLGLATALATYALTRRLHPSAAAAFLATALHLWYLWQEDLPSGSPRAFTAPILAGLAWALVSGRRWLAVGLVGLGGLLYPAAGVLGLATLGSWELGARSWGWIRSWRAVKPQLPSPISQPPICPQLPSPISQLLPTLAAALLLVAVTLPGQLQSARFGPATSLAQAREMREFHHRGRVSFFNDEDPYRFWIAGGRSGLGGPEDNVLLDGTLVILEYAALAALLPLLLLLRRWLPAARLRREAIILPQLLIMSAGLFFLAHAVLFKLYLPNRYVKWTVPLALAVAGGLVLGILIDSLVARLRGGPRGVVAGGLALGLAALLTIQPARYARFRQDEHPRITQYLREQPVGVLVAGAPNEADGVPSFARRSVLTAREFALAYHVGYYEVLRQRTLDLMDTYYTGSPREVLDFARRHDVDLFLVNRDAFDRREYTEAWGFSFQPFTSMVRSKLDGRSRFALLEAAERCATVDDRKVAVVERPCLERMASR